METLPRESGDPIASPTHATYRVAPMAPRSRDNSGNQRSPRTMRTDQTCHRQQGSTAPPCHSDGKRPARPVVMTPLSPPMPETGLPKPLQNKQIRLPTPPKPPTRLRARAQASRGTWVLREPEQGARVRSTTGVGWRSYTSTRSKTTRSEVPPAPRPRPSLGGDSDRLKDFLVEGCVIEPGLGAGRLSGRDDARAWGRRGRLEGPLFLPRPPWVRIHGGVSRRFVVRRQRPLGATCESRSCGYA